MIKALWVYTDSRYKSVVMIRKQRVSHSSHAVRHIKPSALNCRAQQSRADSLGAWGARQTADLAELNDWVEGLRAAAHEARNAGNVTLAEALDITRFEVYDSYLDEEYTNNTAKRSMIKS
jgi:hypothetical protein